MLVAEHTLAHAAEMPLHRVLHIAQPAQASRPPSTLLLHSEDHDITEDTIGDCQGLKCSKKGDSCSLVASELAVAASVPTAPRIDPSWCLWNILTCSHLRGRLRREIAPPLTWQSLEADDNKAKKPLVLDQQAEACMHLSMQFETRTVQHVLECKHTILLRIMHVCAYVLPVRQGTSHPGATP